ncbi:MAG: hypothetical protein K6L74_08715 [Neptuniibacter sp.]
MKEKQENFDPRVSETIPICIVSSTKFAVHDPVEGNWELGPKNQQAMEANTDAVGKGVESLLQELVKVKYSDSFKINSHIKIVSPKRDLFPQKKIEAVGVDLNEAHVNELRNIVSHFTSLISEGELNNNTGLKAIDDPRDLSILVKHQQEFLSNRGGKKITFPIVLTQESGAELGRIKDGFASFKPENIGSDEYEGHARVVMLNKGNESCKLDYEFVGPEESNHQAVKFKPGRHWAQLYEALGSDSPYKFLLKKQDDVVENGKRKKGEWTIQHISEPDDGFLL